MHITNWVASFPNRRTYRSCTRCASSESSAVNFASAVRWKSQPLLNFVSSLWPRSVHQAAKTFLEWDIPLHVLINNAGILVPEGQLGLKTEDGFEVTPRPQLERLCPRDLDTESVLIFFPSTFLCQVWIMSWYPQCSEDLRRGVANRAFTQLI